MQYCAVYINQGLNAHREAFSPAIIIEELLLQRFLHTLNKRKNDGYVSVKYDEKKSYANVVLIVIVGILLLYLFLK